MKFFLVIGTFLLSAFATHRAAAAVAVAGHAAPADVARVYQCSMHPWIKSDRPGKCTICGMALVSVTALNSQPLTLNSSTVTLAPSVITTIGVETSSVSRQPLTRTLRVNGAIDDDDTRHRLLTAWADGRVEKLYVRSVGATVQAGEPLLDLYSPDLQTAQREFVQLAKAGELAASALPAARARLLKMGLTDAQLDDVIKTGEPKLVTSILAPDGGTVVEKDVYEGQWLKTGDKLFAIGDFSKMWFLFDAYEQDIPWLRVGQKVEIFTRAMPGEIIEAPIEFIDPNFNEMTRTTKVRVILPNPHVGASGESHVHFHRVLAEAHVLVESPAVLAAPRSAVLDAGNGPVAFVDLGQGNYERRKLHLGRRGDALVEVLDGLKEGDNVVTTSALLIDGQAQLAREASLGSAPSAQPSPSTLNSQPSTLNSQPSPLNSPSSASTLANAAIDAGAALASDDYASYQKFFPTLAAAAQNFPDLPKLVAGENLKAARQSFEPWSTAVADLLKPQRAQLGLKIFQCPMSPVLRTGRWVQRNQPLKNPFFGSAMPNCGTEVP